MKPPPPAPRFVGWLRLARRGPWVRTVQGPTFGDCWQRLLDRSPGNCDLAVMPLGKDPNRSG